MATAAPPPLKSMRRNGRLAMCQCPSSPKPCSWTLASKPPIQCWKKTKKAASPRRPSRKAVDEVSGERRAGSPCRSRSTSVKRGTVAEGTCPSKLTRRRRSSIIDYLDVTLLDDLGKQMALVIILRGSVIVGGSPNYHRQAGGGRASGVEPRLRARQSHAPTSWYPNRGRQPIVCLGPNTSSAVIRCCFL